MLEGWIGSSEGGEVVNQYVGAVIGDIGMVVVGRCVKENREWEVRGIRVGEDELAVVEKKEGYSQAKKLILRGRECEDSGVGCYGVMW